MIHINCGNCKLFKGCDVKRIFQNTAKQYDRKFDLKCPYKTPLYSNGDQVKFTVGYGCTPFDYYFENENGQEHIFHNRKYEGNIEFEGEIVGNIQFNKFIIQVPIEQFNNNKHLFNEGDIKILNSINENMGYLNNMQVEWDFFAPNYNYNDKYFYFISKLKFIKRDK